jgi:2'-5' RNA ligase
LPSVPKVRLGVVLLLPEPVSTEVDGLRRAGGDGALGLVPPHVTLVPPVNVKVADVNDAVTTVRTAATAVPGPLRLEIGPAATFSPLTPVLYLRVGGDVERLSELRQAVLKGPLDRPAEWEFVPHVTIAGEQELERLEAGVAALADYHAEVTVERLHLLQEGDDRVWRPLADAPFGPPIVIGRGGLPVELAVTEILDPAAERFLAALGSGEGHDPEAGDEVQAGRSRGFAVTARREGHVVAVASTSALSALGEASLDRLLVAPDVRRQGLGSQALAALELRAVALGCRTMTVVVLAGGPAERFFGERGWTVERSLPRWRSGADYLRLIRHLRLA